MISILLACYNGEEYICEQIESLLTQTYQDFIIYINDDYSNDKTFEIIEKYNKQYPDKIITTRNIKNSGSAKHNFMEMMIQHKDDYVMLCDQDDIWLPDKIERTLEKMLQLESKFGKQTPLLVFTDLYVVDENLLMIADSYQRMSDSDYKRSKLEYELTQNIFTGCTGMYNRALASFLEFHPNFTVMHDWWLMLIACLFGKIDFINEPTILYRQHMRNSVGAKDIKSLSFIIYKLFNYTEIKKALEETYLQADSLLKAYSHLMTDEQKILLERYSSIPTFRSKLKRWKTARELGTLKYGINRRIAHFLFI